MLFRVLMIGMLVLTLGCSSTVTQPEVAAFETLGADLDWQHATLEQLLEALRSPSRVEQVQGRALLQRWARQVGKSGFIQLIAKTSDSNHESLALQFKWDDTESFLAAVRELELQRRISDICNVYQLPSVYDADAGVAYRVGRNGLELVPAHEYLPMPALEPKHHDRTTAGWATQR